MRRRSRIQDDEERGDHDRWLVSYADFITLLFAFFVVMYALSSINESKYRALSNSLIHAFGRTPAGAIIGADDGKAPSPLSPSSSPSQPLPPQNTIAEKQSNTRLERERDQLTEMARGILRTLAPLVGQGKVRVSQNRSGISIEINASVLFAPGQAVLTAETGQALRAVAEYLKYDNHAIRVEGHTDSVPIHNASFPSNWELSSVRASSVVRLFVENGIEDVRLTAVGKGATEPVGDNATPEGRQRNRRVTIQILSRLPDPVIETPVVLEVAAAGADETKNGKPQADIGSITH